MTQFVDRTGQKYGRLTVLQLAGPEYPFRWICSCDCGGSTTVIGANLANGNTKSCGCLFREWREMNEPRLLHAMSGTPTWVSWSHMKDRCYNSNASNYPFYGGRGIRVCKRWYRSFELFFEDMGERPQDATLGRIDNDGHYMPGNCRWETKAQQANNTRRTKR